jgi:hypothetical protein
MKSIIMPNPHVQLSEETKAKLAQQEVKETLANEAKNNEQKKFTATDMWNRNRNSRSASDRIRRWNLN